MDTSSSSRRRFGRGAKWTLAVVGFAVVAVVAIGVASILDSTRPYPSFPSLESAPDPTLVGTVAYVGEGSCIHVARLSGASYREVYCLPAWSVEDAKRLGKPTSPQLVWLDGGRLEVAYFRMTDPPSPTLKRGWQFVIDVATGARTDTPEADVPDQPNLSTRSLVNAAGDTIAYSSDGESGWAEITVKAADGTTRTVFREHGPGKYGYQLQSVFWAPDGRNIIVDDGRILVLVPSSEPVTRILVDGWGGDPFFSGTEGASGFAVTSEEFDAPG